MASTMVHEPSYGLVKPEEEGGSTPLYNNGDSRLLDIQSLWLRAVSNMMRKRPKRFLYKPIFDSSPGFDKADRLMEEICVLSRQPSICFRGQPIDALGHSLKELNYDQVSNELNQTDAGEKYNPLKHGNKRKIDPPETISSFTRMVTVKTTFRDDVVTFQYPISSGFSYLKYKVAQRFKIKDNRIRLKYIDEANDEILIACDDDLKLAVETTAINNSISLICLLDVDPPHDVIQPLVECWADNFSVQMHSSDSESLMATAKKRKLKRDTILPVIGMVTANITYNKVMKVFQFFISSGITNLENEVARIFKLKGKKLRLKYRDEDDDLILIACDVDLNFAVVSTSKNNIINLICMLD